MPVHHFDANLFSLLVLSHLIVSLRSELSFYRGRRAFIKPLNVTLQTQSKTPTLLLLHNFKNKSYHISLYLLSLKHASDLGVTIPISLFLIHLGSSVASFSPPCRKADGYSRKLWKLQSEWTYHLEYTVFCQLANCPCCPVSSYPINRCNFYAILKQSANE